jgi:hypothetical protein
LPEGPAGDLGLGEDTLQVLADGARGDAQPAGGLVVGAAGGDQFEHLAFPRAERRLVGAGHGGLDRAYLRLVVQRRREGTAQLRDGRDLAVGEVVQAAQQRYEDQVVAGQPQGHHQLVPQPVVGQQFPVERRLLEPARRHEIGDPVGARIAGRQ